MVNNHVCCWSYTANISSPQTLVFYDFFLVFPDGASSCQLFVRNINGNSALAFSAVWAARHWITWIYKKTVGEKKLSNRVGYKACKKVREFNILDMCTDTGPQWHKDPPKKSFNWQLPWMFKMKVICLRKLAPVSHRVLSLKKGPVCKI